MFARFVVVAGMCLAFTMAGCARVKPYQREDLARKSMTGDEAGGERRFNGHIQGSREASAGGSGEPGGGCGCN